MRRPVPRSVPVRTARAARSTWTRDREGPSRSSCAANGMVQHDVASTDVCMKSANPSVLTARYRPRMRRAVSPTSTETTAVATPARSRSRIEGDASSQVRGDVGADRHQPELPQRDLARPAGEDRERQGDDAVDADLGHEERPIHAQHERQQRGHDHGHEHTRGTHPSSEPGAGLAEGEGPRRPRGTLRGARALLRAMRPARAAPAAATRRGSAPPWRIPTRGS